MRLKNPCPGYLQGTYVEPYRMEYSLGGANRTQQSASAAIYQFPVKLAFACTAHKMQGQTIAKPKKVVMDIESCFQDGMAYVMLSRTCLLEQIFILNKLEERWLKVSEKALRELERLHSKSLNKNPTNWNNLKIEGIRIASLNIRSLRKHLEDVRIDSRLMCGDLVCLQETWIYENEDMSTFEIDEYNLHLSSNGKGKGVATYCKKGAFKLQQQLNTKPLL